MNSERNVKKDEDGHYYPRSSEFDQMSDPDAVHERASRHIELMNGATKLNTGGSYQPVEFDAVTRVDDDGKRHHYIMLSATVEGRSRMTADPSVNLYKAWEVICDAAGGLHQVVRNGWTDDDERRRFTGTAQSRDELGDAARHASEKYKAPKNPMTLDEARAFVRSVIEAWVRTL